MPSNFEMGGKSRQLKKLSDRYTGPPTANSTAYNNFTDGMEKDDMLLHSERIKSNVKPTTEKVINNLKELPGSTKSHSALPKSVAFSEQTMSKTLVSPTSDTPTAILKKKSTLTKKSNYSSVKTDPKPNLIKLSNIHNREFKNKFEFMSAVEHLKFRTFGNLTYL